MFNSEGRMVAMEIEGDWLYVGEIDRREDCVLFYIYDFITQSWAMEPGHATSMFIMYTIKYNFF